MTENPYKNCRLCPRNCGIDRTKTVGYCGSGSILKAARAGLHFYEEPYLSGTAGSGTIFFTGCSLGCVYCQNYEISVRNQERGFEITAERLAEIFLEQQARGANNINLVTGTHFTPSIAEAIRLARSKGLTIPTLWNSSGYEKVETLQLLEGLIDIWLPDFKTLSAELGKKYMNALDYPEVAKEALDFMVCENAKSVEEYLKMMNKGSVICTESPENVTKFTEHSLRRVDRICTENSGNGIKPTESGSGRTDRICADSPVNTIKPESRNIFECKSETKGIDTNISADDTCKPASGMNTDNLEISNGAIFRNDLMIKGVNVRHLVLPGSTEDSKKVVNYLHNRYGDKIWISIMSQYTPVRELPYKELNRKLTKREYNKVVDYAIELGVENAMIQEGDVAETSFIPKFDGEGIVN